MKNLNVFVGANNKVLNFSMKTTVKICLRMKEVEKRGSLPTSFPFKNVTDKANFLDYKWPRTSSAEKKISTPYDK